jgi:hypothetical protein
MSRINYINLEYNSIQILEETQTLTGNIYTFKLEKGKISNISRLLGLTFIKDILYFNFPAKLYGTIHKDIDIETKEYTNTYSLILPLENCQDLYVNWFYSKFKVDETIKRGFSHELMVSPSLEQQDSILLENQKLDRPAFIKNIDIWHNAENRSNEIARFINIRFYKFLSYEKSLDLVKKITILQ